MISTGRILFVGRPQLASDRRTCIGGGVLFKLGNCALWKRCSDMFDWTGHDCGGFINTISVIIGTAAL